MAVATLLRISSFIDNNDANIIKNLHDRLFSQSTDELSSLNEEQEPAFGSLV